MKKGNYILENSYTIPLDSEVLFEYYSNLDYILTSNYIYICSNVRKGINLIKIPLPFNEKNIKESENKIIPMEDMIRFKLITINYDDIADNVAVSTNDSLTPNSLVFKMDTEKNFINKNYLIIYGKVICLYDLNDINLLHQCQPLASLQQSIFK